MWNKLGGELRPSLSLQQAWRGPSRVQETKTSQQCIPPSALQVLQAAATWLLPFLHGESVSWENRRRLACGAQVHGSPGNICSTLIANEVSLIVPEWKEQEVNTQNAELFPTVHMVPSVEYQALLNHKWSCLSLSPLLPLNAFFRTPKNKCCSLLMSKR